MALIIKVLYETLTGGIICGTLGLLISLFEPLSGIAGGVITALLVLTCYLIGHGLGVV